MSSCNIRSKLLVALLLLASPLAAQDNSTARRPFGQHTQTFSATPTFDAGLTDSFKITLTGNVTSSTLIGAEAGHTYTFEICQDSTGSRTFAWPSQMVGPIAILATANVCTQEIFVFDGTSAINPTTATSGGGGSGTVNAGTTGQVAYYGANGTTISGNTKLDEGNTTPNTLTYTGTGGMSAPTFNSTGSGPWTATGTEGTPSGATVGKDVLSLGDIIAHCAQISNNGDSFRCVALQQSTSPTLHGLMIAATPTQIFAIPTGAAGQPILSGGAGADPGAAALNLAGGSTIITGIMPKANHPTSTVFNDQVNTFTAAGTVDLSASTVASAFRVPSVAGLTTSISSAIGYDSTSNMFHGGQNAADSFFVNSTAAPANNDCPKWIVSGGNKTLGTTGSACAGGATPALSALTAAVGANSINNGDNAQTWNASLTTAGKHWFTVTENSASVATGVPYLWDVHSIASSTANPVIFTALGTANGWNLLNSGALWAPVGTGALAIPGSAKGVVVSQGGAAAATTVTGTVNQLVTFDVSGNPIAADPIISYNYINLWTAQDVTVTRTSASVRNPIFSQTGTLQLTWASITGSPATCTLQVQGADSVGNALNNGSTFSVSPANGTTSQTFTAAAALQSAAQIKAIFACGTYPTTGTLTLDFTPIPNINVTNTVAVSAASLPLPAGASTSAKQPALGTAGSASTDVITIQGIVSMTPVKVDGSATTQPVSGTVTANIGTSGSLALDASVTGLEVSQGSTTSGQKGALIQGAVTTSAPSYTTAQTSPLSLTTAGALRTDSSAVTQPVSGTVSANATLSAETTKVIGTIRNLGNAGAIVDAAGQNAAAPANWWGTGCAFFTSPTTLTNGNGTYLNCDTASNLATRMNSWLGSTAPTVGQKTSANSIPVVPASDFVDTATGNKADDGAAAGTDRLATLPAIEQAQLPAAGTAGRNKALRTDLNGTLYTGVMPTNITTYTTNKIGLASAASATDIAVLPGNATNTVIVTRVQVSCTQTTAGIIDLQLIKRSTADTAGTSASMTIVPLDSGNTAASSAPLTYTANPTTGTPVGNVDSVKLGCMAPGTVSPADIYVWKPGMGQSIVLRGTAQQLAVNLNGVTVTGGSFDVTFSWIESSGL